MRPVVGADGKRTERALARKPPYVRSVLVVDDDVEMCALLRHVLEGAQFNVTTAHSVKGACDAFDDAPYAVAFLDQNLPDGTGLDIARHVRSRRLSTEMVMMTGFGNLDSAKEAIRFGLAEYLEKPLSDVGEVATAAARLSTAYSLKWANRQLIKDLREKNAELEVLAARDPLTGLFNHAHLQHSLEHEIARCRRHDLQFTLVLVDLDHFKQINDTYGHLTGDRVLEQFATIFRGDRRASDSEFRLREEDIAARIGGDEFALILPGTTKRGASQLAERLRDVVAQSVKVQGTRPVTMSIGIASFPEDGGRQPTLFEAADVALYAAKNAGRDRWVAYNPSLSPLRDRQALAHATAKRLQALEETIEGRRMRLAYQPIVHTVDRRIAGYEAMCRPSHPQFPEPRGLIQTAESAGRIDVLGAILLELAFAALPDIPDDQLLFINLHPHQVLDPHLLPLTERLHDRAHRIVFEITEIAEITATSQVKQVMRDLRTLGVRIALDDLGSGYSGLNSLASFEPDFVKLDMQLVHGIDDPRTARLIRYMMDFSEAEGIQVIAEGVETRAQQTTLTRLGCSLMQGHLFGHPAPLVTFSPAEGAARPTEPPDIAARRHRASCGA